VGEWVQAVVYALCRPPAQLLVGLLFRLRAYGQERLPKRGGALLLANHQSYADPVLLGVPSPRRLAFMAREPLFRNPVFGALIRALGAFPVRQGKPDKSAIRLAVDLLRSGRLLVLYPEGTRTPDGAVLPIKGGFRLLVRRAGVPVIPVALQGAFEAWPRSRRLPRPGRIRVLFGRPIPPSEFDGLSDDTAAERVHGEISSLLETLQRLP